MRCFALVALMVVLAVGCGKKDTSPRGLCARACDKILGCLNAGDQQDSCIDSCAAATPPPKERVEQIEAASCDEIMQAGMQMMNANAPRTQGAPRANGGVDCRGCVGDNSSCYMAAGGANGIPCDPSCCAPGGPAPTWKTPE